MCAGVHRELPPVPQAVGHGHQACSSGGGAVQDGGQKQAHGSVRGGAGYCHRHGQEHGVQGQTDICSSVLAQI